MTAAEIDALAEVMTRRKLAKLTVGEVVLELSPMALLPEPVTDDQVMPNKQSIGEEHGNPTEQELLFWSTPLGPPPMKAEPPAEVAS